jgi:hypothetical protein
LIFAIVKISVIEKRREIIMKKLSFISISLFLAVLSIGCASILSLKTLDDVRAMNKSNLSKLNIGMDREEVLEIMGTKTIKTYRIETNALYYKKDRKIPNPYKTEIRKVGDKSYEIIYYYTEVKKRDGTITDDELTPLVFDNGELIGWGWSFFEETLGKTESKEINKCMLPQR